MDEIDQALQSMGLIAIQPDEIHQAFQAIDCKRCFYFTRGFMKEDPEALLWFPHLLALDLHQMEH